MQRSLNELRDVKDPAWPVLQGWIKNARNHTELLPTEKLNGEATLVQLQVTAGSILGAVASETGGLLVDGGWLRILGAASTRLPGGLNAWNGRGEPSIAEPSLENGLIVGYDVLGGFFAVNGGAFNGPPGNVFYFAPDTLDWEDMRIGYSAFLRWVLDGDLAKFYETGRWPGWQEEVAPVDGDRGITVYPFLWAREGGPVEKRHRGVVPMKELWAVQMDMRRQMLQR